jgi:hypothetical protein
LNFYTSPLAMLGKLRSELEKTKRMLAQLKPQSAPGILTGRTTRGVTRVPTRKATEQTNSNGVARWA